MCCHGCNGVHVAQSPEDVVFITARDGEVVTVVREMSADSEGKWVIGPSDVSWVENFSPIIEAKGEMKFLGSLMKGHGDKVEAIAYRNPGSMELTARIETSRPLTVRGNIVAPDGSKKWAKEVRVGPGQHEIRLECSERTVQKQ